MINIQTCIINSRFKLPRNQYYFCSRLSIGNLIQAGLPNITGKLERVRFRGNTEASGAFTTTNPATVDPSDGSRTTDTGINFDASHSSSIYGNSNTVQPLSVSCYLMMYVN